MIVLEAPSTLIMSELSTMIDIQHRSYADLDNFLAHVHSSILVLIPRLSKYKTIHWFLAADAYVSQSGEACGSCIAKFSGDLD